MTRHERESKVLHSSAVRLFLFIALSGLGLLPPAHDANAQGAPAFNDVSNQTQTPIPGSGHDYQHLLGETVNFSNGSVSFKISFPVAPSRGITLPYAWSYTSSGVNPLNMINGNQPAWDYSAAQSGPIIDGWNTWEGIPWASLAVWSFAPPNNRYQTFAACNYQSGMTFTDSSGVMHNLNTAAQATSSTVSGLIQTCGTQQYVPPNGDGQVAAIPDPDTSVTYLAGTAPQSGGFVVMDKSGTVYSFGNGAVPQNGAATLYSVLIEDKNGNKIVVPGSGGSLYTDTSGRPGPTVTSSGALQVGNLNYQANWGTTSVNYTVAVGAVSSGSNNCAGTIPASVTGTRKVLNSLGLPNGQQFTFLYDNPYGLLSEIIYPDGGWVKYTWAPDPSGPNEIAFWGSMQQNQAPDGSIYYTPISYGCSQTYQTPVLQTRTVSFDGSNVAQTQSFTYTTNWTTVNGAITGWSQKTTTATTTDQKVGLSATTKYTYLPYLVPKQLYASGVAGPAIPLEREIDYNDWGKSTPAKIVTKTWADQFDMASEVTTIVATGQVAGTIYSYGVAPNSSSTADSFVYLLEQDDYDYGTGPLPVPATTNPPVAATTSSRTATKKTIYNYTCCEMFPASGFTFSTYTGTKALSPMSVPPQLASVFVEDGAGAIQAVTRFAYDGSAIASVSPVQHDPNYGTGMTARGNLTSVTRCTSPSANCTTGPTTSYAYDLSGQPSSMTDAKGNTTTYSFADSPAGSTNAFLTKITYPNGLYRTFQYNYSLGYLTSSTDLNPANTTTYYYSTQPSNCGYLDKLDRLTEVDYPDGGKTTNCYNDSGASVTTSKLLTSSLSETSVSYTDGLFHTIKTQLTSDPDGTTTVDTSYDGEGRVYTKSNPYRSSASATDGTTTFHYDALGRLIETAEQDGTSLVQTCYDGAPSTPAVSYCSAGNLGSVTSGARVDTTDELGRHRQQMSDFFGRFTEVMEPNGTSNAPSMETDYTYNILNNLTRVDQWGGAHGAGGERVRTFMYDNLSRLISATNPETGTITYSYLNSGSYCAGDVSLPCSKTDARNVTTAFTYDSLNRLTSKSYSNDSSGTPSSCYQYDSSLGGNGRLSNTWTQSASSGLCSSTAPFWTKRSIISYDPMGRVLNERQFAPGSSTNGTITPPPGICSNRSTETGISYCYDLAGNLTFSTNGMNSASYLGGQSPLAFTSAYDGAGRLRTTTSNYTNGNVYPANLFSPPTGQEQIPCVGTPSASAQYWPTGGLMNSILGNGVTLNRAYDNRLRMSCENDTGSR
jgi:YD repeat-containing protein